jgi:hypothetical protein
MTGLYVVPDHGLPPQQPSTLLSLRTPSCLAKQVAAAIYYYIHFDYGMFVIGYI